MEVFVPNKQPATSAQEENQKIVKALLALNEEHKSQLLGTLFLFSRQEAPSPYQHELISSLLRMLQLPQLNETSVDPKLSYAKDINKPSVEKLMIRVIFEYLALKAPYNQYHDSDSYRTVVSAFQKVSANTVAAIEGQITTALNRKGKPAIMEKYRKYEKFQEDFTPGKAPGRSFQPFNAESKFIEERIGKQLMNMEPAEFNHNDWCGIYNKHLDEFYDLTEEKPGSHISYQKFRQWFCNYGMKVGVFFKIIGLLKYRFIIVPDDAKVSVQYNDMELSSVPGAPKTVQIFGVDQNMEPKLQHFDIEMPDKKRIFIRRVHKKEDPLE